MTTKAIDAALDYMLRSSTDDEGPMRLAEAAMVELTTLRRDAKTATDCGCIRAPYGKSEDVRAAWRRLQDVAKEAP